MLATALRPLGNKDAMSYNASDQQALTNRVNRLHLPSLAAFLKKIHFCHCKRKTQYIQKLPTIFLGKIYNTKTTHRNIFTAVRQNSSHAPS
jgi:hypothetical protein